jgi:lipopolysaccharide exporter
VSLARKTVSGIAWTLAMNVGSRAIGLVGTLLLARYLDPADYGEVMAASVVAQTAQSFSNVGIGQYLVARPEAGPRVAFHVTFYSFLFSAVALAIALLVGPALGPMFKVTHLMRYLPALALVAFVDRIATVPERLLFRDLRFKLIGIYNAVGDLIYTAVSLALVKKTGGMAIVWGNVARSLFRSTVIIAARGRSEWLEPRPIRREVTREIFSFGLPLTMSSWASFVSRRWDNMVTSHYFGPAVMGAYNYAYNLAAVPATQIGEQIGDVLFPSFAHLGGQRKREAYLRSTRLLALLMFPMSAGLGAVAQTLVGVIFDARWREVGPMLAVLCTVSITYPMGYLSGSYLQVAGRPGLLSYLEVGKTILLFVILVTLGPLGPLWVCVGVSAAFAAHALVSVWLVQVADQVSFWSTIRGLVPPLAACVPLVGAVLGVRALFHHGGIVPLVLEILAGAAGFIAGAYLLARPTAQDFIRLVRRFITRRSAPDETEAPAPQAAAGP